MHWFRRQAETAEEYQNDERILLHYPQFGSLAKKPDGSPDPTMSPLVSIYLPEVRRGALWTVGEVHFLHKAKARFHGLDRMRKSFALWFGGFPIVWERSWDREEEYGYYLEGTIRNIAEKIHALPHGMEAFEAGQYFVAEHDNEYVLDRVCKSLRLRGVNCS